MGKTRAKNLISRYGDYGNLNEFGDKILNIQVHGDAAIIGQGVNQECLTLSGAPNFNIGGTVHLVVNNQVGYTTPGDRGRSSRYCTDLAKVIAAPVIHVNGNYPEEVYKITKLAFDYQRRYKKDIFVDMNCYRRWGHNEMDDPTFTNPALYKVINAMRTVPDSYAAKIIEEGVLSEQQCQEIYEERFEWLNEELQAIEDYQPEDVYFQHQWAGISQPENAITTWDTGVDTELLAFVGEKSVAVPEDFTVHPTLTRHVKNRLSRVAEGMNIDWSTSEALAIGCLLFEGYNVRISGQDVGRGTFSQRHAMLVDQNTNQMFIPLNSLYPEQTANLEVANSILSEEAVLGYEYGMSIESPKNLIVWEAQFGDFFNGAQIIFDTFVTCGEAKWLWQSALTVLLPHGYDGAGPEHSSARIERFLQLTDSKDDAVDGDDVNLQVCHPSTPAQYFHLLRRQMVRNFRKPLIVFTPKTLLRSPLCVSSYQDMIKGTHFKPVLGDTSCEPSSARRLLITSGKHYYNLLEAKQSLECETVAIIRLESYCPFPTAELLQEVLKYNHLKDILWCQEEPQNMGAWSFVKRRFENLIGKPIKFCGRPASATPAVGFAQVHLEQANDILTKPFQM
ncbi:probable 2-oxoglutarate dehydrogenase E1 component DHKTD1 homolog, mitochondrial [Cylas formicarius]|uniref:probable 2-oxoglutarate dehydrogenase E1 component DHKTD1 homolog, mitochondrial n=1 Tax=Cylas formicarius TaxID=197179 RepID=UPI0029587577|nr:probable 2-oxoglutarate dehydrogenase E1 component DHKTD1 homolog, mitochondrial [Cylas formicarius]